MASPSHADVPVLEEWYETRNRPHACGVVGCTSQLVTKRHVEARLCDAHIKCPAVLRGGVPQRWCGRCSKLHALEAFDVGLRCAPASRWERSDQPQD